MRRARSQWAEQLLDVDSYDQLQAFQDDEIEAQLRELLFVERAGWRRSILQLSAVGPEGTAVRTNSEESVNRRIVRDGLLPRFMLYDVLRAVAGAGGRIQTALAFAPFVALLLVPVVTALWLWQTHLGPWHFPPVTNGTASPPLALRALGATASLPLLLCLLGVLWRGPELAYAYCLRLPAVAGLGRRIAAALDSALKSANS